MATVNVLSVADETLDKMVEEQVVEENGKIKFPLDLFTAGEYMDSDEFLTAVKGAKEEIKPEDEEAETPKLQTLAKGFMFQAAKSMAGAEPFYTEVHLIGENQYAISANKNGVLTRNDIKALRKSLKALMNQEKEEFSPEPQNDGPQYDDGMNDSYYGEDKAY